MTTPSNALPESRLEAQEIAPATMSPTRPLYWSVRRELWENRSVYLAPLAVAAVFLFGFLISLFHLRDRVRAGLMLDPTQQRAALETPYNLAAALIMGTTFIVGIFYCIDALYGERKDRSILFWKSLPVSDLTAVMAKTTIPFLFLPLLTLAITMVSQLIIRGLSAAVLFGTSLSVATRWTQLSFFHVSLSLLYHLFTVHVLWYSPFYAWLLLVSSWARRAPLLWAALPPIAISGLEKIAFGTSHFAEMLKYRLNGPETFDFTAPGSMKMDPLQHIDPAKFLTQPGLWIGLVIAVVFLAGAVRLRRYRGPI